MPVLVYVFVLPRDLRDVDPQVASLSNEIPHPTVQLHETYNLEEITVIRKWAVNGGGAGDP